LVVLVVAIVVIGPKDLPKVLRKLGQYAGKLRRMAADLRAQSGIDEALRAEGLADDLAEIRKLARGEIDAVRRAATVSLEDHALGAASTAATAAADPDAYRATTDTPEARPIPGFDIPKTREYPRDGADSYGALADDAFVYQDGLVPSALATCALYTLGDSDSPLAQAETS